MPGSCRCPCLCAPLLHPGCAGLELFARVPIVFWVCRSARCRPPTCRLPSFSCPWAACWTMCGAGTAWFRCTPTTSGQVRV
jgi:hypothetical protein